MQIIGLSLLNEDAKKRRELRDGAAARTSKHDRNTGDVLSSFGLDKFIDFLILAA